MREGGFYFFFRVLALIYVATPNTPLTVDYQLNFEGDRSLFALNVGFRSFAYFKNQFEADEVMAPIPSSYCYELLANANS